MLARLQQGLERLYRIDTSLRIDDYLIDEAARLEMGVARAPREQLLVLQEDGALELGLFIDEAALALLTSHDPAAALGHHNLGDFLLTVEGVSHFVYVAWRAQRDRPVSALEMELQAEVDKYVTCLLTLWRPGQVPPRTLPALLFTNVTYADDLDDTERDRYRVANENAHAFASSLHARYVFRSQLTELLAELRRFYRLGAQEKLAHIARAA